MLTAGSTGAGADANANSDDVLKDLLRDSAIGTAVGTAALLAIGAVALLVIAALAAPVRLWRTGDVPQPELQHSPPERGTLDVVALGPLTYLAALLAREPALARRMTRVIAVMGRRPGHRFHPSETHATGAMLFGHGPVFRELHAVRDPQAVAVVLASSIPVALVPCAAARQVSMTGGDLDRVALAGPAGRWVAARSLAWRWWHSRQACRRRQRPRHRRSTATWCTSGLHHFFRRLIAG